MVKVAASVPLASAAPSQGRPRAASDFAVPDQPAAAAGSPGKMRGTGPVSALSGAMLLTLQENGSREQTDEDARRRGRDILAELTRLQCALLSGSDAASLDRLEELSRIEPGEVDPALAGALSSIRLRARIELARRGRVAKASF
ncbi:flagellar assembly protein FliX [Acetobacteraceae bacterium KSS8]|uniref:Flagellar assembly protein FliX n=1 Tax=Endosaccharibacter trunci TaxID=2812733 RepID=A0ABT1W9U8_9PROT|nr:flagellar assembly protein FliX [Acetobacteraceae bacterium KSS8]